MQYNPKLKIAMDEIKTILKKYDLAASIVLHTPGSSGYLSELSPSYSCAKFEGNNLRIRGKKKDYATAQEWEQKVKDTCNMLHHLSEKTAQLGLSLLEASKMVDGVVNAEHFGNGDTSHTTQNN